MKKNKKKIIIISIAILLVIGIGVTLFVVLTNREDDTSFKIDPVDAEKYYKDNSDVVSITAVTDSENVASEKDTFTMMEDRGFTDYPITTNYSLNGDYYESKEINDTSTEKHPSYNTYYLSSNNDLWGVSIIDGNITAYPVSYNLEEDVEVPIILVETDTIVSYDSVSNKFFETIPNSSDLKMVKIPKINASSLDEYELEGNSNE